jgi:TetR/AcrR family transcriptional regulator, transcriptional repressor for nem operon
MKATRGQIVREARELFREHGYSGASMQDLADRVGLKKPSLYTRFASKEALVSEVLTLTIEETFADLPAESDHWIASYEAVLARIAGNLGDRKRCVGFHLAHGVSPETPEAASAVRDYFNALRERIAGILRHGMSADRAQEIATDALVRLEGATLWIITTDDRGPMQRALAALLAEAKALT